MLLKPYPHCAHMKEHCEDPNWAKDWFVSFALLQDSSSCCSLIMGVGKPIPARSILLDSSMSFPLKHINDGSYWIVRIMLCQAVASCAIVLVMTSQLFRILEKLKHYGIPSGYKLSVASYC